MNKSMNESLTAVSSFRIYDNEQNQITMLTDVARRFERV